MELLKLALLCAFVCSAAAGQVLVEEVMAKVQYLEAFEVEGLCSGRQSCSPRDCVYEGPMRPNLSYSGHASCDCHFHCLYLGTCCLNFEEVCLSRTRLQWLQSTHPQQISIHELAQLAAGDIRTKPLSQIDRFLQLRQRVAAVEFHSLSHFDFPLVTGCPNCGTDRQCNELKDKCEFSVASEWTQLIYVAHEGLIFKNKFCAGCYFSSNLSSAIEIVRAVIDCEDDSDSDSIKLFDVKNFTGILNMVNGGHCKVRHLFSSLKSFSMPKVISKCGNILNWPLHLRDEYVKYSDACSSYVAYVQERPDLLESNEPRTFRNKHCALCNSIQEDNLMEETCLCSIFAPEGPCANILTEVRNTISSTPSFSVGLDYASNAEIKRLFSKFCHIGIQDTQLPSGDCVDMYCPQNAIKIDTDCVIADAVEINSHTQAPLSFVEVGFPRSLSFDKRKEIVTEFVRKFPKTLDEREEDFQLQVRTAPIAPQNKVDLMVVGVKANINLLIFKLINSYQTIMLEMNRIIDLSYINVANNPSLLCPDGFEEKISSNFMFMWVEEKGADSKEFPSVLSSSALFFPEYELKLDLYYHHWAVNMSRVGDSWKVSQTLHFCYKLDTECIHACNNSVRRNCTLEPLRKIYDPEKLDEIENQWPDLEVIQMCTFILAILSIIALSFCLIVHRLFPELLESVGEVFTHVLIGLLAAEVGLILSGLQKWSAMVCSVLAAWQHFAWLASFFWTFVWSWDICFTFFRKNAASNGLKFLKMLVGWGIPLIIVVTCGILHILHYFNYGGDGVCWINGSLQLFLSFGFPVGLIFVINSVLYAMIGTQLNRAIDSTVALDRRCDPKVRFFLCCKLSATIGFTWVFSFLANISGLGFFKHVFSVCAGLNGILVSLSFAGNSKTVKIIRSHIEAFQAAAERAAQSQPGSSSEFEKC